jgi:hypothetical protein
MTSLVSVVMLATTAGCFDTYTARRMLFPDDERPIIFVQGNIALVSHNFTGPLYNENITVGGPAVHNSIDNFYIGEGGANLSIFALVHFIPDTQMLVSVDDRYVDIILIKMEDNGEKRTLAQRRYTPEASGGDYAEVVRELDGIEPGLYSLRVIGKGTAEQGTSQYDWFKVFVLGRYSDRSHNHNAPEGSNLP